MTTVRLTSLSFAALLLVLTLGGCSHSHNGANISSDDAIRRTQASALSDQAKQQSIEQIKQHQGEAEYMNQHAAQAK